MSFPAPAVVAKPIIDQCVEETNHVVGLYIIIPFLAIMVVVHLIKLCCNVHPLTVMRSFFFCLFLAGLVFAINVYYCCHVREHDQSASPPSGNLTTEGLRTGRRLQQYYEFSENGKEHPSDVALDEMLRKMREQFGEDGFANTVECDAYSVQVDAHLDGSVDCCLEFIEPTVNCTITGLSFFGRDQPVGTDVNGTLTLPNGTVLDFPGSSPSGPFTTWTMTTINTIEWGLGLGDRFTFNVFFTYTNGTVNEVEKGYLLEDRNCPTPSSTPTPTPSMGSSASPSPIVCDPVTYVLDLSDPSYYSPDASCILLSQACGVSFVGQMVQPLPAALDTVFQITIFNPFLLLDATFNATTGEFFTEPIDYATLYGETTTSIRYREKPLSGAPFLDLRRPFFAAANDSVCLPASNLVEESPSPSNTPSPSSSATSLSNTPSPSVSNTPSISDSNTATPSVSESNTPSISESNTPSTSESNTPTPSASESNKPSNTAAPSVSESGTPSTTPSVSESGTPSTTPTPSVSESGTPSTTPTPSVSESNTASMSLGASMSITPSVSESGSTSPTVVVEEETNILPFQVIFSILFLMGGYLLGVVCWCKCQKPLCEEKLLPPPCKPDPCDEDAFRRKLY